MRRCCQKGERAEGGSHPSPRQPVKLGILWVRRTGLRGVAAASRRRPCWRRPRRQLPLRRGARAACPCANARPRFAPVFGCALANGRAARSPLASTALKERRRPRRSASARSKGGHSAGFSCSAQAQEKCEHRTSNRREKDKPFVCSFRLFCSTLGVGRWMFDVRIHSSPVSHLDLPSEPRRSPLSSARADTRLFSRRSLRLPLVCSLLRTTLGKCRSVSGAAQTLDKRLKSAMIVCGRRRHL